MSFSKQGEMLDATTGSEPHQAALTALAKDAQTAQAVRTSMAGDIVYVAVPARFGPGKPVVGTAAFAWDMSDGFARQAQATMTTALVGLGIIVVLALVLYVFVRASITGPLRKLWAMLPPSLPTPIASRTFQARGAATSWAKWLARSRSSVTMASRSAR